MSDYIDELNKFLGNKCPMPGHWCNGQPIPVSGRKHNTKLSCISKDASCVLAPCPYWHGKCLHPDNPKTEAIKEVRSAIRN